MEDLSLRVRICHRYCPISSRDLLTITNFIRQWDEPRLLQRATQLVDRNPNRRLFQPQRVEHAQPATLRPRRTPRRRPSAAVMPTTRRRRSSVSVQIADPPSSYEADFTDHSEWEDDGWALQAPLPSTVTPEPVLEREARPAQPAARPAPPLAPVTADPPTRADVERNDRIAEAVEHLRTHHACTHDKWRYRKGRHQCEQCRHVLKEYIFECRQCSLQACNRCRRNRL